MLGTVLHLQRHGRSVLKTREGLPAGRHGLHCDIVARLHEQLRQPRYLHSVQPRVSQSLPQAHQRLNGKPQGVTGSSRESSGRGKFAIRETSPDVPRKFAKKSPLGRRDRRQTKFDFTALPRSVQTIFFAARQRVVFSTRDTQPHRYPDTTKTYPFLRRFADDRPVRWDAYFCFYFSF